MKKTTALCAALCLLAASTALAYENPNAGYSVKDKNSFYKLESSKNYAFSDVSSKKVKNLDNEKQFSVHIVNYYTAEEMSERLGEAFSTAYFEREYEKLALLQRSQLDMRTVPSPLLDLEKYNSSGMLPVKAAWPEAFYQQFNKLKPTLRIDTLGGRKIITLSYLYKQQANLVAYDLSFVSANDRLYLLSTYNMETNTPEYEADKSGNTADTAEAAAVPESIETNDNTSILSLPEKAVDPKNIKEAIEKLMQLEQIDPTSLDKKKINGLWNTHKKFLNEFKTMQPIAAQRPLRYTDTIAKKTVTLPQDWFYGQMQMEEKEADICLTFAGSMTTMQKIAKDIDYMGLMLGMPALPNADCAPNSGYSEGRNKELFLKEIRKALTSFDAMLMTLGVKVREKGIGTAIAENTNALTALEADNLLREGLERIKRMSNDKLALTDYDYQFDFAEEKLNANITADVQVIREFTLKNLLRFGCQANGKDQADAYALLFISKPEFSNETLQNSIDEWQF